MNFIAIDISLLVMFVIFISVFLYRKRKNLKREGLLFLYKTTWGMKFIDKIGKKYKKTLGFLSYIMIGIGYILMGSMLYLFGKIIYIYIAYPAVVRAIKIPPITPLLPYLPQAFKLDFLPPFYFTYWILILAIIAITHEFMHGIFMRRYDIKIKSTGFGFFPFFFPIFLAAFVEQDEKSMNKSSPFKQMTVLAAGTFANVLTAILFFGLLILFFTTSFTPAGADFNTYSYSAVTLAGITSMNNLSLVNPTYNNLLSLSKEEGLNEIQYGNKTYLINKIGLEEQKGAETYILLYDDAPAIRAEIDGTIIKINGVKIVDWVSFGEEISKYSPGDNVTITTEEDDLINEYKITLGENPENPGKAWVGVGYAEQKRKGVLGSVVEWLSSFKKDYIHYEPKFEVGLFIYDLLWWLVLISISVALMNMLPMGIFDGGKFFYLTILSLTKSQKKAELWFKISTNFLLFLFVVLMILWGVSFFVK
ncbi:MAG: site-2 protease family protein [Candidatus Pacearchaeota archaeon]|nr:site-2 protease family protein [Candidatus Pacearchaeota archaeon]